MEFEYYTEEDYNFHDYIYETNKEAERNEQDYIEEKYKVEPEW